MNRPIAVVDSDVLLLLLDNTGNAAVVLRRKHIELVVENLERQNARLVVPAPVIAELWRSGPGSAALRQIVKTALKSVRVEVLDEDAAGIAGEISRTALADRKGRERGAVKFDALIAAIAHRIGARWLLTGNPSDMRRCLSVINSTVEVVDATAQPVTETGQTLMVPVLKPGS